MKIKLKTILLSVLVYLLLIDIFSVFNLQFYIFSNILIFLFLTLIPGLLILLLLKLKTKNIWEYLIYLISLSTSFLIFIGLGVNWILPLINNSYKPLTSLPLLIIINVIIITLTLIIYKRTDLKIFTFKFPQFSILNKVFIFIPFIFPILSIAGATYLNNGGSNYLTLIMLVSIAIDVILITIFKKSINSHIYPLTLWMISIALLLMYSLRSWNIIGIDINQEYLVFNLTNNLKHWSPTNFSSDYNLCLSITILPTIYSSLLKINPEYIFKLIIPLIFSIVPLTVYLLSKKILSQIHSFFASFFFVSQVWFIEQMPALARQEIAFIFFSAFLITIFNMKKNNTNITLLIIFGISMILSHYSTAYIWIALILIYWTLNHLFNLFKFNKITSLISIKYILLVILITIMWESQIPSVTGKFTDVMTITFSSLLKESPTTLVKGGLDSLIFNNKYVNTSQNIYDNYLSKTQEYKTKGLSLYPHTSYQNYNPSPILSKQIDTHVPGNFRFLLLKIINIIKLILIDTTPFIGILILLLKYFKKKDTNSNVNYLLISMSSIPLIILILFLPYIKYQYNLTRLFLQILILLASLSIFGFVYIFSKLKLSRITNIILLSMLILYFLYSSEYLTQIIGGIPSVQLNNFGDGYDRYMVTKTDKDSAIWLSTNITKNNTIYADDLASLRLISFGNITNYSSDILPSTITKSSYVYLDNTNVKDYKVYKRYKVENFLIYSLPITFLDSNKNLIYNNGGSEIFK